MAIFNVIDGKDDLFRAFILYSFVGALAASLAVHIRLLVNNNEFGLSDYVSKSFNWKKKEDKAKVDIARLVIAIIITFIVTIIIYHVMWILVGFGGGLLSTKRNIKYFN